MQVGKTKLDSLEFHRQYQMFVLSAKGKTIEQFLDYLTAQLLLREYAASKGWDKSEEYKRLAEYMEKTARRNGLLEKEITDRITVNDEDIQTYYQLLNTEFHLKHLLFPTRKEAWQALEKLRNGADWNALARETFADPALKQNGGDLGWYMWISLEPAIADRVKDLPLKAFSEPIQSADGFHIIKIENMRYNPIRPRYDYLVHKQKMKKRLIHFKKRVLADKYIYALKQQLAVKIKRAGLQALYEFSRKWPGFPMSGDLSKGQNRDEKNMTRDFDKIKTLPLVSSKKGLMTIGDFLEAYLYIPQQFRIPLKSKKTIIKEISEIYMEDVLDSIAAQRAINPMDDENYKLNLLNAEFKMFKTKLAAELNKKIKLNDRQARKYYEKNKAKYTYPDSIRYAEYRFKNKSDAEEFIAGKTGAPLRVDTHAQWTALTGELPFAGYLKPLASKVYSPPIQTTQGVTVLYIYERKKGGYKPFNAVKKQVLADAIQRRAQDAFRQWLRQQKQRVNVYMDRDWIEDNYSK